MRCKFIEVLEVMLARNDVSSIGARILRSRTAGHIGWRQFRVEELLIVVKQELKRRQATCDHSLLSRFPQRGRGLIQSFEVLRQVVPTVESMLARDHVPSVGEGKRGTLRLGVG